MPYHAILASLNSAYVRKNADCNSMCDKGLLADVSCFKELFQIVI